MSPDGGKYSSRNPFTQLQTVKLFVYSRIRILSKNNTLFPSKPFFSLTLSLSLSLSLSHSLSVSLSNSLLISFSLSFSLLLTLSLSLFSLSHTHLSGAFSLKDQVKKISSFEYTSVCLCPRSRKGKCWCWFWCSCNYESSGKFCFYSECKNMKFISKLLRTKRHKQLDFQMKLRIIR